MSELEFSELLEKAIDWASDLEAQVLESGVELRPDELFDARLAGVKEPARVRVLFCDEMPLPSDPLLAEANRKHRILSPDGFGMTLGYALILRSGGKGDRRVLVHELVHAGQYERLGGMDRFLREYLTQILRDGYAGSELELEAARRTQAIVGR